VSPRIVRSDDDVAEIQAQQQAQAEQAQAAQAVQVGADAAGKLGRAQMEGTALGALMQGAQGAPPPGGAG
jgi:hypothetical protein